jgi:hypothetical protein
MKVVAIETREEQDLLRGFLGDNLGSRGPKLQNGISRESDGIVLPDQIGLVAMK